MSKKILIVDDDGSMRDLLRCCLCSAGFEVFQAGDEETFRGNIREGKKPDLIILDIMLGKADGVQVYEQCLREGFDATVPVIFLSVLARDIPPTPPQPGRVYSLLSKPFDPDQLVKEISHLVNV